jgi:hypothetical protein
MSQNAGGKQADLSDNHSDGGLSVNEAQAQIEALLGGDDEDTETSTAKPAKGVVPPNSEDDDEYEPTADDVGEPTLDEDEQGTDEEDDEQVVEEDDDAPAPAGRLHTTKVDGEDVQVTLQEALAGYSRNSSFTKKSQALAEEKRQHSVAVAAKEAEIRASQEHYVAQLAVLEKALATPEPDWAAVQRDNPSEFANLHAAWRIHQDNLQNIRQEQATERAKLAQKYQGEHIELVKAERAKLIEAVPLWGDKTEKGATFRKALLDFGVTQGFDAQELNSVADHRALKILHKAFLHDQALAEKGKITAKGKAKVEALKTIVPGTARQGTRKPQTVVQKAKAKLQKSGNVRDAAAALEAMM